MTDAEVSAAIILYELELGIPATDALTRPSDRLVDMVLGAFPALEAKLASRRRLTEADALRRRVVDVLVHRAEVRRRCTSRGGGAPPGLQTRPRS